MEQASNPALVCTDQSEKWAVVEMGVGPVLTQGTQLLKGKIVQVILGARNGLKTSSSFLHKRFEVWPGKMGDIVQTAARPAGNGLTDLTQINLARNFSAHIYNGSGSPRQAGPSSLVLAIVCK
jgi:hypothetical protein